MNISFTKREIELMHEELDACMSVIDPDEKEFIEVIGNAQMKLYRALCKYED